MAKMQNEWISPDTGGDDVSARVLCPTLVIGVGSLGREVLSRLRRLLYVADPNFADTTSILCIEGAGPPDDPPSVVRQVRTLLLQNEDHVGVDLPDVKDEEFLTRTQAFEAFQAAAKPFMNTVSRELRRITNRTTLQELQSRGYEISSHGMDLYLVGCIAEPLVSAAVAHVPYIVEHLARAYAPNRALSRVAVLSLSNPDAKEIIEKDYDQAMSWAALAEIHAHMQRDPKTYEMTWAEQRISQCTPAYHACYLVDEIDSAGQRLNSAEELAELVTPFLILALDQTLRADADTHSFAFGLERGGITDYRNQAACFRVFGLASIYVPKSSEYIWAAIEQGIDIIARGLRNFLKSDAEANAQSGSERTNGASDMLTPSTSLNAEVSELERKLGITDADLDALFMRHWMPIQQRLAKDAHTIAREPDDELDARMIDKVSEFTRELAALRTMAASSMNARCDEASTCSIPDAEDGFCLTKWWEELVSSKAWGVEHVRRILGGVIANQPATLEDRSIAEGLPSSESSSEQDAPDETRHAIDEADRKSLREIARRRRMSVREIHELPSRGRMFWDAVALSGVAILAPWMYAWQGILGWLWCLPLNIAAIPSVYYIWRFSVQERDRIRETTLGVWAAMVIRWYHSLWESIQADLRMEFRARFAVTCKNILDAKIAPIDSRVAEIEAVLRKSLSYRQSESRVFQESFCDSAEDRTASALLPISSLVNRAELVLRETELLKDNENLVPLQAAESLLDWLCEAKCAQESDADLAILSLNSDKFDIETKLSHVIVRARNPFAGFQRIAPHLGAEVTLLCTPSAGDFAKVVKDDPSVIHACLAGRQKIVGLHVVTNLMPESLVSAHRMRKCWARVQELDSDGLRGGFADVTAIPKLDTEIPPDTDEEVLIP